MVEWRLLLLPTWIQNPELRTASSESGQMTMGSALELVYTPSDLAQPGVQLSGRTKIKVK
jgi:hypothetical protein